MKAKISILVFLFVFSIPGSGKAWMFHGETEGQAPLVRLWEQSYSPSWSNWLNDLSMDGEDNIIVTGFIGLGDHIATTKL